MKKIILSLFAFSLLIPTIKSVKAEEYVCDTEEYNAYKLLADQIELSYEHVEDLVDENGNKVNNMFNIVVNNLHLRLALYNVSNGTGISGIWANNGTIKSYNYSPGTYTFEVRAFSAYCDDEVFRTISITIPKYNEYSEREECSDVNPNKFAMCDPYYQGAINEETFKTRVEQYKNQNKEELVNPEDKENGQMKDDYVEKEKNKNFLEQLLDFITQYYLYLIIGVVILIAIIITLIILSKKGVFKKRKEKRDKFKN